MDRYEISLLCKGILLQHKVKGIAKSIFNSVVYFSNYFYIRMNLFWNCFLPIKSHGSRYNIYLKAKCRLFLNNSFTPERMIYEVVLTFESADEIRWCDHLNEISLAVLSHGTVYLVCSSNFWVCGRNPLVLPFKWNIFGSALMLCYLFLRIL